MMAEGQPEKNDDATKAVVFMAIKAAIFILIPLAAALIAVLIML